MTATWFSARSLRSPQPALIALALAVVVGLLAPPTGGHPGAGVPATFVDVVVRGTPSAGSEVARAVTRVGGAVTRPLDIIDGVAARVPSAAVPALQAAAAVVSVTRDATVDMHHTVDGFDAEGDVGSLYNTMRLTKARDLRTAGYTGAGIDVALIDTGVTPVDGLLDAARIVDGPDFSYESGSPTLRNRDGYGHGTHMAGIIAGGNPADSADDHDRGMGVAPGARIVNVKVGGTTGATDVSQVIAALDWVVQHRRANGLNIRVVNLAFGTNGAQRYELDPLTYAAEVAWRKGIVVVVAAGNAGKASGQLSNPAYDPYVLAVGADDTKGTMGLADDVIPEWSSRGDGVRNPDVVAPGRSIASARVPGSTIDVAHPKGIVNARLTRGSGTSQAAAVVSGGIALLLQRNPALTPDQVKYALQQGARSLPAADVRGQGAGLVNFSGAAAVSVSAAPSQTHTPATGSGSLHAARGDHIVSIDGTPLEGERTVWGGDWDSAAWAADAWAGSSWSGSSWSGSSWSGGTWSGSSWSGSSWSGSSWSGTDWLGSSWSGSSWSGSSWSGSSWSGSSWSTAGWLGASWG